jgi:type VI secretion system secreted protein VgrG
LARLSAWLISQLAYLALSTDYRIYQDQQVPNIVASLFQTVTSNTLSRSLQESYPIRELIAQFAETDLNFFHRQLEDQGIFYFFSADGLIPILGDSAAAYLAATNSPFRYFGNTATNVPAGAEFVRTFQKSTHESALQATLRSYNFKTPSADLTGWSESSLGGRGDRYEFGHSGTGKSDNTRLARTRVERQDVERSALATVEADGVALAAIQGLNRKVEQQREENAALRRELEALKELVGRLTRHHHGELP